MLVFAYYAIQKPSTIVAFAFCVFVFEQLLQTRGTYFVNNGSYVNIALFVLCMIGLATGISTGQFKLPKSKTFWLILVLLLYCYASFFWITKPAGLAYDKWVGNIPYLVCVSFISACFIRNTDDARVALKTTLVFGMAICIFLVFFCQWEGRELVLAYSGKAPDLNSSVLAIASLGNYVAIIGGLIELPKFKSWKILRWLCIALGLYLALKSQSRGQVIILVIVIIAFTPISKGQISLRSIIVAIVVVTGIAICMYLVLPYVSTTRWQEQHLNSALDGRYGLASQLWAAYTNALPVYWITGLGAGASFSVAGFYIHNVPLEVLCEEGIFGAVLYLSIVAIPTLLFLKIVTSKQRGFYRETGAIKRNTLVIVFALMVTEFGLSLKSGSLYGFQNLFLLLIMIEVLGNEIKRFSSTAHQYSQPHVWAEGNV